MRDLMLQAAGVTGIVVAIVHGVVGETKVFANATIEPPRVRLLLRLVWLASSVAWAALGVLLVVAPMLGSESARHWIVAMAVATFASAAAGNAIATRGRHVGWMLLTAASAAAMAGL